MKLTIRIEVPEWANYIAQDEDGTWYFHENKPRQDTHWLYQGIWESDHCDQAYIDVPSEDWTQELWELY
jgi:hypothetical protein